ncbi:hypothetical protein [Bacillus sp. FSL K6-3431]|uniref:hypothetical protein n=1 Tax=Bacillus sp. FSL K6-3431 TaxID=2921500 RepID=UPI0030FCF0B8
MKKTLLLLLTLLLVMTACDSKAESENKKKTPEGSKEVLLEENPEESKDQAIEVDKGILNVEITLPPSLFEGQDIDEVIAEAKNDGVNEVKLNDDGSLTYKMPKAKHKEILKELESNLLEYVDDVKIDTEAASIKDITHNKDFSEFTLVVDQEAFEDSFDGIAVFGLAISALFYQAFIGVDSDDYKVTVFYKNVDTGNIFNTVVYPDAFEE